MLMGQGAKPTGIIFDEQVRHGLAHIPQEPFGNSDAFHHASGQHRQEGQQIIAAAF
ncbi:MAG: hypothetical protein BWY83_00853 [bacterium ADurb.Bin478]|nr:MAG: hypothetical protein BWY83_00853 [bacterium ADurb.Bin478]